MSDRQQHRMAAEPTGGSAAARRREDERRISLAWSATETRDIDALAPQIRRAGVPASRARHYNGTGPPTANTCNRAERHRFASRAA